VAILRENKAPLAALRDGLTKSEAEVFGLARGYLGSDDDGGLRAHLDSRDGGRDLVATWSRHAVTVKTGPERSPGPMTKED